MNKSVEIGLRLKDFVEKNFDSVADLARQLGLTRSYFVPYFKGKSVLGGETLAKLAELGCDINWLLNGTTSENIVKEPNGEYMTEYSSLLKESNVLKEENRDLKALIFDLQRDKEQLVKQNERHARTIQDLKEEITELQKGMAKSPT